MSLAKLLSGLVVSVNGMGLGQIGTKVLDIVCGFDAALNRVSLFSKIRWSRFS